MPNTLSKYNKPSDSAVSVEDLLKRINCITHCLFVSNQAYKPILEVNKQALIIKCEQAGFECRQSKMTGNYYLEPIVPRSKL